ncbi:MAG: 2-dehydropantoate 2-reductase [Desulfurococcaceae archaeon TW002]
MGTERASLMVGKYFRNVLVVGGGNVGVLLTYALISSSTKLSVYVLIRNTQYLNLLKEGGVKIFTADGSLVRLEGSYFISYEELRRLDLFDMILVATKAYDSLEAIKAVKEYLRSDGVLITCQNGLRSYEEALNILGPKRTATAVLNHGVYRVGPQEFRWIGGSTSYLGSKGVTKEVLYSIASLFKVLGFQVVDDIEPYRWLKLAVNAAINPLTTLYEVKNKFVVTNENLFKIATMVVTETQKVAEKYGVRMPADPLEEVVRVAEATGENYSSMLQDLMQGKKTEIDYINGEIVLRGREVGVSTPVNEVLWLMIKYKESLKSAASGHVSVEKIV